MSGVQITHEALVKGLHQHYGEIIASQAQAIAETRAANDVLLAQQEQRNSYFEQAKQAPMFDPERTFPPGQPPDPSFHGSPSTDHIPEH